MNVVFRADAGPEIGTGHVMRCAALAQALTQRRMRVHLLGDVGSPALAGILRDQGIQLHEMTPCDVAEDARRTVTLLNTLAPVGVLVVDHYGLGVAWEQTVRPWVGRLAAFDDLGRAHDCAVVIDQNLHRDAANRYAGRVPAGCRVLVGPQYAALRPQFEVSDLWRPRDGQVRRLSVFFGGTDVGEQIGKVLEALRMIPREGLAVSVVCGPANPLYGVWQAAAQDMAEVRVLRQVTHMAAHLAEADLALGCCGVTAWERCVVGLPALVSSVADNQVEGAILLHERGAVRNLGWGAELRPEDWAAAISALRAAPEEVKRMGLAALDVMEGWSAARAAVVDALISVQH